MRTLKELLGDVPQRGEVRWLGVRPARGEAVREVESVRAIAAHGLDGDRYGKDGKRQVSLIQAEHLDVIARLVGHASVEPRLLRRNVVVAGINVKALQNLRFRIGGALLEGSGSCEPCSKMEEALGHGGYHAMRGMGGIVARVLESGEIRRGDAVVIVEAH
ncbi:MAG: MOSC domain-containing protein [Myxococcales bacterium]|nr:MOSC domain-containing protein [Myxococcales bacterium]